jgi:hypothetical protein
MICAASSRGAPYRRPGVLPFSTVCSSPVQPLPAEGERAISIRRRARISSVSVAALALELAPVQPGEASAAARVLRGGRSVPIEARVRGDESAFLRRIRSARVSLAYRRNANALAINSLLQRPLAQASAVDRVTGRSTHGLGELRVPWDTELSPVTGRRVPVAAS